MNNEGKIGFCGDVCSECPRYMATMAKDIPELENIAKLWYRLGFRDQELPPEQLMCEGCSTKINCSHGINLCEHLKDINNCGECQSFPCNKIESVFQKTETSDPVCQQRCSDTEYATLYKAFFMKKEILFKINKTHFNH